MTTLDSILGAGATLSLDEARSLADDPDVVRRHQADLIRDLETVRSAYRGVMSIYLAGAHWSIVLMTGDGPTTLSDGAGHEAMADEISRLAAHERRRRMPR